MSHSISYHYTTGSATLWSLRLHLSLHYPTCFPNTPKCHSTILNEQTVYLSFHPELSLYNPILHMTIKHVFFFCTNSFHYRQLPATMSSAIPPTVLSFHHPGRTSTTHTIIPLIVLTFHHIYHHSISHSIFPPSIQIFHHLFHYSITYHSTTRTIISAPAPSFYCSHRNSSTRSVIPLTMTSIQAQIRHSSPHTIIPTSVTSFHYCTIFQPTELSFHQSYYQTTTSIVNPAPVSLFYHP